MSIPFDNLVLEAPSDDVDRCLRAMKVLGRALPPLKGLALELDVGFPLLSVFIEDDADPSSQALREARRRATRFVVRGDGEPKALFDVHAGAPHVMPSVTFGAIVAQTLDALRAADRLGPATVCEVEVPQAGLLAVWAESRASRHRFWVLREKEVSGALGMEGLLAAVAADLPPRRKSMELGG